ncbi:MAG: hypothetical protein IT384_02110 [Deltaproteobacteria bacterium]|nr:hypothetical protein [Deltaproteobacteria bacterium]
MDALLSNLTLYMIIGLVIVLGIAQINRFVGSLIGIVFWISVAILGSQAYARGGGIALVGAALPEVVFYGLCGVLIVVNAAGAFASRSRRR